MLFGIVQLKHSVHWIFWREHLVSPAWITCAHYMWMLDQQMSYM